MAILLGRTPFTLTRAAPFETAPLALAANTAEIRVRLRRSAAWDDSATVRVSILEYVDGREYAATAQFTGGERLDRNGQPYAESGFSLVPQKTAITTGTRTPVRGVDGKDRLQLTWRGETAKTSYVGAIRVELLRGTSVALEILSVEAITATAPTIVWHHSVAYDNDSSVAEQTGDGVVSVTIDPNGTTDLAAFAHSSAYSSNGTSTCMYDGAAMTEIHDASYGGTPNAHSAYYKVGIGTGSVTVTHTMSDGSPGSHVFGVITMTGVNQSSPVGTAVTTTGTTADPMTVTVSGTSASGLVVAGLGFVDNSAEEAPGTVGADQTEQYRVNTAGDGYYGVGSTQDGAAGGVMSWANIGSPAGVEFGLIAIEFKATPTTIALTGTATSSMTESDVVSGGKTIILTVTGDTWLGNDIVTPVIEAADCTVSGSNTAADPWTTVAYPNASAGDLLIFYIAWDDSTATTDVDEPAGPNSEVLTEIVATPVTDSGTETRAKAWYTIATGTWTAGNLSFNPSATESWSATCIRIPAGEFDAVTPIGAIGTAADTGGGTDATVDSPAFTAGSTDGDGKLVWCAGVDADPLSATPPTGWSILQRQDLGAVAHGVAVRDTEVTDSESIASATWSIAGDSWTSIAFVVRAPTTTPFEDVRDNIRDGIDSAQSEATGWDALKTTTMPVTNVVRTSDTVVTITLAAAGTYDITAQETITATVPAAALNGAEAVVASPTFTIDTSGGAPAGHPAVKRMGGVQHAHRIGGGQMSSSTQVW